MRGRLTTIVTTFGAVALVMSTMGETTPTYIWNASKSVPIGLYQLQPAGPLAVTELVAVRPPEPLATFLDLNGYLPRNLRHNEPGLRAPVALPLALIISTAVFQDWALSMSIQCNCTIPALRPQKKHGIASAIIQI